MSSPFTSSELRSAARQATSLALSSWCPQVRKSLLEAADRLMAEAEAGDSGLRKPGRSRKPAPASARPH